MFMRMHSSRGSRSETPFVNASAWIFRHHGRGACLRRMLRALEELNIDRFECSRSKIAQSMGVRPVSAGASRNLPWSGRFRLPLRFIQPLESKRGAGQIDGNIITRMSMEKRALARRQNDPDYFHKVVLP